MSRDQNAGRSHDIKTDNSCFERVEQFRYLGTTLNQNSIQEDNKCRLKSQNAYHSVQNTVYKTAHIKVFTDYWMYPVSLFASIFPYSKQKSTYTYYHCEVHSALKEKKVASTSNCLDAVRARSQQLFYHCNNLVASSRLASETEHTWRVSCCSVLT